MKVLLIEDSEDDAFFFQVALEKTGVPCEVAHMLDGSKAIEYLRKAQASKVGAPQIPDVIFLDLKMPIFNGFEVLEWIGRQKFKPALRIAVLSGSDHARDIQMAQQLGASEYLVKPLSPEELRKRLLVFVNGNLWNKRELTRARSS